MREKRRKEKRKGDLLLLLCPFTPSQENVARRTSMGTMKATIPFLQHSQKRGEKDTRKTSTVQHWATKKKLYANEDNAISTWQLPFLGNGPRHLNNKNWKGAGSVKRGQTPREPLGFSWLIDPMNSTASPTPASSIPPPPAPLPPLQVWKEKYWESSCLGSF